MESQHRDTDPEIPTTLLVPEDAMLSLGIWVDQKHYEFKRTGARWAGGENCVLIQGHPASMVMIDAWLDGWIAGREGGP